LAKSREKIEMTSVKDLTIDELEYLIEQKILELLGDPDSGLELKRPSRRIPHHEVVDRIG
jgi:hypothetical protein